MLAVMRHDDSLAIPDSWHIPALMGILAMLSILAETFLTLALWTRRWRRLGVVVGLGLHTAIVASFDPSATVQLTVFALAMLSLDLLFFDVPQPAAAPSKPDAERPGELSWHVPAT